MKLWTLGWMSLAVIIAAGCCATRTQVNTDAIQGAVDLVVARVDAYVLEDPELDAAIQSTYLSESQSLTAMVYASETIGQATIKPVATLICARHDEYVQRDMTLDETKRMRWLNTTKILMEVIDTGD